MPSEAPELVSKKCACDGSSLANTWVPTLSTKPEVVRARAALISAEAVMVRMKQRVQAVERKKEMVQSVGANRRIEMQGDPTIRKNLSREGSAYRDQRADGEAGA